MNIYFMLGITIVFLIVNYILSSTDIMNPSFIFSGINFAYISVCCFNHSLFGGDICDDTVYVLSCGLLIFTICNTMYLKYNEKRNRGVKYKCKSVAIRKELVIFFLALMLITSLVTIRHIINVTAAYGGGGNVAKSIGIFDNILKFTDDSIGMPTIYSVFAFPIKSAAYIFAAVLINNHFFNKKIDKYVLIYCVCYLAFSLLNGGRSEIVRYLMAIMIDIIVIRRRILGSYKKGNIKTLFKVVLFVIALIGLSFPLLYLIGKSSSLNSNGPLILFSKYVGGPIYNLDSSIRYGFVRSTFWGQETFQGVYNFIANVFEISDFKYRIHIPTSFINGLDLGNVYTMYYMFFEDFGYVGIFLVIPICIYYFSSYGKLMDFSKNRSPLSMNLFIYSYMFNALVMLLFSNRFYENMFSYNFIKLFVSFYMVWFVIRKVKFNLYR